MGDRPGGLLGPFLEAARRLHDLCDEFGPLSRDHRVAELGAEIAALRTP